MQDERNGCVQPATHAAANPAEPAAALATSDAAAALAAAALTTPAGLATAL